MTATLYTKPGCPYCDAARRDLEERGVGYDELDITKDPAAEDAVIEITGGPLIVPITVEDDQVRVGFPGT